MKQPFSFTSGMMRISISVAVAVAYISGVHSFQAASSINNARSTKLNTTTDNTVVPSSPWFTNTADEEDNNIPKLKTQILQLGAALDRGQSYNPTSGDYYASSMDVARQKIQSLIALADAETNVPKTLDDISGEWELVFTTVKHGIFRSSPFFLAVQEAFEYGEEKEAFGEDKATLFFKLHELQTCSVSCLCIHILQSLLPSCSY